MYVTTHVRHTVHVHVCCVRYVCSMMPPAPPMYSLNYTRTYVTQYMCKCAAPCSHLLHGWMHVSADFPLNTTWGYPRTPDFLFWGRSAISSRRSGGKRVRPTWKLPRKLQLPHDMTQSEVSRHQPTACANAVEPAYTGCLYMGASLRTEPTLAHFIKGHLSMQDSQLGPSGVCCTEVPLHLVF